MRIIKVFLIVVMTMLFIISCKGKEQASEEKIRITIEREDKGVQEAKKAPEQSTEKKVLTTKKPEPLARTREVKEKPEPSAKAPLPPTKVQETRSKSERFTKAEVPPPKRQIPQGMDFKTVAENLSLDIHSKKEVKAYWLKERGKTVTWMGKVHSVDKGRRGFKILVDNPVVKSRKGFNIILIGKDVQNVESISEGQTIRFRGVLTKFEPGKAGASPLFILSEAEIL